jgi:cyclic pyranopterin phosphate synthase
VREGHLGRVGYIAPSSHGFCATCNRLRVSSRGALKLCLFGERDEPLRAYLRSDDQQPALVDTLRRLAVEKPSGHHLEEGCHGNTWSLAVIGG